MKHKNYSSFNRLLLAVITSARLDCSFHKMVRGRNLGVSKILLWLAVLNEYERMHFLR